MSKTEEEYGWTAVPRPLEELVSSIPDKKPSKPMSIDDVPLPDTPLVQSVRRYAEENYPKETFHHCMRIYYYGQAIATQHFPSWRYSPEAYFLVCLLHDIGTTPANISSTRMSFEFYGGYLALDLLKSQHAPIEEAELVSECIIRHQDLGDTGMHTTVGALTHLSTIFDNAGANAELVHEDTIKSVTQRWPRLGWTQCFANVVRKEKELKPWSHTTKIQGFEEMIESNKLMEPYD